MIVLVIFVKIFDIFNSSFVLIQQANRESIAKLILTGNPNKATNLSAQICAGESYVFNGNTLTSSGIYTANLTAATGCDSVEVLTR